MEVTLKKEVNITLDEKEYEQIIELCEKGIYYGFEKDLIGRDSNFINQHTASEYLKSKNEYPTYRKFSSVRGSSKEVFAERMIHIAATIKIELRDKEISLMPDTAAHNDMNIEEVK